MAGPVCPAVNHAPVARSASRRCSDRFARDGDVYSVMPRGDLWIPHYGAPYTVLFVAVIVQCMRHCGRGGRGERRVGPRAGYAIPACVVAFGADSSYRRIRLPMPVRLLGIGYSGGASRSRPAKTGNPLPCKHLVVVALFARSQRVQDWVYTIDIGRLQGFSGPRDMAMPPMTLLRYFRTTGTSASDRIKCDRMKPYTKVACVRQLYFASAATGLLAVLVGRLPARLAKESTN